MATGKTDVAIVGGGLSGGLIALALAERRPELSVVLLEAGETVGGNHRWSWFASDLDRLGEGVTQRVPHNAWDTGYDVRFPALKRTLPTPYRSMGSVDFAAAVDHALPQGAVKTGCRARNLAARAVTLESGERVEAERVIDCRGIAGAPQLNGGWQVFYGRHFRTRGPHGLTRPIIMDAQVPQHSAFRFVYTLPLAEDELFVEDTYYADTPELDRPALEGRTRDYCRQQGWDEAAMLGEETGVLPVVTGGNFAALQAAQATEGVALAGARGGFFHPLTSYTMPLAVDTALLVAAEIDRPDLDERLAARARGWWKAGAFYRRLGSMLFGAAEPEERYRVFRHFYRLPPPLIERFYAMRSTPADKLRILSGRPPVPVLRAGRALLGKQPALVQESKT